MSTTIKNVCYATKSDLSLITIVFFKRIGSEGKSIGSFHVRVGKVGKNLFFVCLNQIYFRLNRFFFIPAKIKSLHSFVGVANLKKQPFGKHNHFQKSFSRS